jgi:hypothetical protein
MRKYSWDALCEAWDVKALAQFRSPATITAELYVHLPITGISKQQNAKPELTCILPA